MKKIKILIPIYNDWQSVFKLLENINSEVLNLNYEFSVIIVNDASTENRTQMSLNLENLKSIKIINMKENRGHGRCNAAGLKFIFEKEEFDYAILMDGDGEDRPEEIKQFIDKINYFSNKPIVGERVKRSESILFKFCYRIHKILTLSFTGKSIKFGHFTCLPKLVVDPHDIDGPVIVKYAGAKGGRGYFIARDYRDFRRNALLEEEFTIQEYVLGCRYYLHFFFDPTAEDGFQVQGKGKLSGKNLGRLELMSMDRRDESNVDEFYKLGSLRDLREMELEPSFVVTGNQPVVLRESLLPEAFRLAEGTVAASYELEEGARGMIGAFCLETIVTDQLEFKVFEISARIVAGSNPFVGGSPYSDINEWRMSTGRRIARSIRRALEKGCLDQILS